MNKIILSGNVTKDIELKATQAGTNIASFSLAVSDYNGKENVTYFFNCKAFGKKADLLSQYVKKGNKILVSGKMTVDTYEEKKYYNVLVDDVEFLTSKVKEEPKTSISYKEIKQEPNNEEFENFDDLPF